MTTTRRKLIRRIVLPEDLRNRTGYQSTSGKLDTRKYTITLKNILVALIAFETHSTPIGYAIQRM